MSVKIECVEAYDADWRAHSQRYTTPSSDDSRTVQSQAEEADINTIVRRFGITGQMPQNLRIPVYQDFDEVFDFQSAQNAIIAGEREFMRIPPEIRAKFENSPQKFLEFASDINNKDEMIKLGLLKEIEPVIVAPPKADGS